MLDRKQAQQDDVRRNRLKSGYHGSVVDGFGDDYAGDETNLVKKGNKESDVAKNAKQ